MLALNHIVLDEMNTTQMYFNNLAFEMDLIASKAEIKGICFNNECNDMYVEHRLNASYLEKHYHIQDYAVIRNIQSIFSKKLYMYVDLHCTELDLYYHYQEVKGNKKAKFYLIIVPNF